MKKNIIILSIICVILLISSASALTFVSLGSGRYNVTFASGNTAIISNIIYDSKTYVMNITVNASHKGLSMKDIIEAKEYSQTVNGRAKRYDKNIIDIS